MSSQVGRSVKNMQLWRRYPDVGLFNGSSFASVNDYSVSATSSKEKVVRLVVGSLFVVDWLRGQWLLGLFVLSIIMAYYYPVYTDITTSFLTHMLVVLSLVLSGASFPTLNRSAAEGCICPCIIMGVVCFIVSPLMGMIAYLMFSGISEANYLWAGLMCTFCLPPSTILSVAAVRSSHGNGVFSQYLSAIGSLCGVFLSPLLMVMFILLTGLVALPSTPQLIIFPLAVIGPFVFGIIAQRGFACLFNSRGHAENTKNMRFYESEFVGAELCAGSLNNWRRRAVYLNSLVLFLVNYFIFSFFFAKSVAPGLLIWQSVALIIFIEFALYILLCVVSWMFLYLVVCVPEEHIALFFALITKSEVLVVPIVLFLFHENSQVALVLFPSLTYHFFQTIAAGILSFLLRRWRYHYNCRPGTTLLPLRLTKMERYPLIGL